VTPPAARPRRFHDPYYRAPARFVSRRDAVMPEVRPEYLEGKKVGAIAGTSHEAYLKAMFTTPNCIPIPMTTRCGWRCGAARSISIFGDAISLAFWDQRHRFRRMLRVLWRPFVESRYFGEGIGIAVRKGNDLLRQSLNWAAVPALGERPRTPICGYAIFR